MIAFIEETFIRGAMQTAITRESGAKLAIALTSLLYAVTHFIGRYRVAAVDVNAWSGVELLKGALMAFAHPVDILDAFVCLTGVGVLLGMVRHMTGNIAACIGLHAGWVAVIYVVRETSERNAHGPALWLLSDYDGFIGWMVCFWTLAIGWALWWWYGRKRCGDGIGEHCWPFPAVTARAGRPHLSRRSAPVPAAHPGAQSDRRARAAAACR